MACAYPGRLLLHRGERADRNHHSDGLALLRQEQVADQSLPFAVKRKVRLHRFDPEPAVRSSNAASIAANGAPMMPIVIWCKGRSRRRAAQHDLPLELDPPRIGSCKALIRFGVIHPKDFGAPRN